MIDSPPATPAPLVRRARAPFRVALSPPFCATPPPPFVPRRHRQRPARRQALALSNIRKLAGGVEEEAHRYRQEELAILHQTTAAEAEIRQCKIDVDEARRQLSEREQQLRQLQARYQEEARPPLPGSETPFLQ